MTTTRTTITLPNRVHQVLKIMAIEESTSLNQVMLDAVLEKAGYPTEAVLDQMENAVHAVLQFEGLQSTDWEWEADYDEEECRAAFTVTFVNTGEDDMAIEGLAIEAAAESLSKALGEKWASTITADLYTRDDDDVVSMDVAVIITR